METVILHPQAFPRRNLNKNHVSLRLGNYFLGITSYCLLSFLNWTHFTNETTLLSASRQQCICRAFLLLYPSKSADRDQSGKLQCEKWQFRKKVQLKVRLGFSEVSGSSGFHWGLWDTGDQVFSRCLLSTVKHLLKVFSILVFPVDICHY